MNINSKDFQEEKQYLDKVTNVIRAKISNLGQELYDDDDRILEFKKFIWDSKHDMDPAELRSVMTNSDLEVYMMQKKGNYLQKLFKIQNNPYFGSIIFKDENEKAVTIYIGITHLEDNLNYLIHDWRSPICSLFYDYEIGKASYKAPGGIIKGELLRKRQYRINEGKLNYVFDNNLNIDDDILQDVLANNSSEKMKNIVNTIQEEQNKIIRNVEDDNLIVQGIAGSGKTSVALHRIAFLLYRIENLNKNNILIFSPNRIFSEYISNVLPELGEENVQETTPSDFMQSYIKEFKNIELMTDFIDRFYTFKNNDNDLIKYKLSNEIIDDIDKYYNQILDSASFKDDLSNRYYTYTKDQLNYMFKNKYSKLRLVERLKRMSIYISEDNFNGRDYKKKTIMKELLEIFNIDINYKKLYINFFNSKFSKIVPNNEFGKYFINDTRIKFEDSFIFIYMKGLFEGFNYNTYIEQIVIDEAQDYTLQQYIILKKIFKKAKFTILGDVNQTINPYYKYDSLKNILNILGNSSKYLELLKTYRSSKEIIEYSNKILGLEHISAVRKDQNVPVIIRDIFNKDKLLSDIEYLRSKYKSLAIITKNNEEAEDIYNITHNTYKDIQLVSNSVLKFNREFVIIPTYLAKGLEFDAVIIYTDIKNQYTYDERYLYYVAITRSQHELIIYNQKAS